MADYVVLTGEAQELYIKSESLYISTSSATLLYTYIVLCLRLPLSLHNILLDDSVLSMVPYNGSSRLVGSSYRTSPLEKVSAQSNHETLLPARASNGGLRLTYRTI